MVKLETDLETDSCSPLSFPFSFSGFQSSDQKIECFNSTNGKKVANFRSKYEDLLNRQTRDPREEVREGGEKYKFLESAGREERLWAVGINMHVSAGPWFMCL